MHAPSLAHTATWAIAAASVGGVIIRPWSLPEAVWAVAGAVSLIAFGLLPWPEALQAVGKATDVYLFLTGMMLLAELARREGLFDFLAAFAVRRANGSASRLFLLVYGVGTLVTVFMSNDATAVVLTPAVFAAATAAKAQDKLPYLYICAFIANAASFVLPISNPANLVIFRDHMPPLGQWIARFGVPSVLSIAATFAVLRLTQRRSLTDPVARDILLPSLSGAGRTTAWGVAGTALVLLLASYFDVPLGWPTFVAAALTAVVVLWAKHEAPWSTLRDMSWAVLPLVAGLFVLVEGLDRSGVLRALADALHAASERSVALTAWGAGVIVALVCNLVNNLPAGLLAGSAVSAADVPTQVASAVLIGVDLGPNLSVTGSLAAILWLVALRRDGVKITAWQFLKLGVLVMPPALLLAFLALMLAG